MSHETSLTRSTEAMRQGLRDTYGADTIALADRSGQELRGVDFAARAPKVGERAPGFELSDARGERVALDELLGAGPVVLVFYRGAWCPYCNLQLAAFRDWLDEIEAAVLSDTGNAVARSYGLEWINPGWHAAFQREHGVDVTAFNGDDSQRLPAAATFVIGPERRVQYVAISADYRWRVGPEEVLAALGR